MPSWARLTGNELVSRTRQGNRRSFLVRKAGRSAAESGKTKNEAPPSAASSSAIPHPSSLILPPFAVMGIGSWPRPRWLLRAVHDYLEGRLSEDEFQSCADDAVRLAVAAQVRAGVDVLTDGEQRRDSYASFVGSRIENCQLVPITDLLPYVADPEQFAAELQRPRCASKHRAAGRRARPAAAKAADCRARTGVREIDHFEAREGRAAGAVSANADVVARMRVGQAYLTGRLSLKISYAFCAKRPRPCWRRGPLGCNSTNRC